MPELPDVDPRLPVGELLLTIAAKAHREGLDADQGLRDAVRTLADNQTVPCVVLRPGAAVRKWRGSL